jgi:hypothetical protein
MALRWHSQTTGWRVPNECQSFPRASATECQVSARGSRTRKSRVPKCHHLYRWHWHWHSPGTAAIRPVNDGQMPGLSRPPDEPPQRRHRLDVRHLLRGDGMTVNRGDAIHAVRVGQVAGGRDHRASQTCWCEPRALLRDLASGAAIWVHGTSNVGHARPESDAMGKHAAPCIAGEQAPATDPEPPSQALGQQAMQRHSTLGSLGGRPPGGTHTRQNASRKTALALFVRAYDFAASHPHTATLLCTQTMHSQEAI